MKKAPRVRTKTSRRAKGILRKPSRVSFARQSKSHSLKSKVKVKMATAKLQKTKAVPATRRQKTRDAKAPRQALRSAAVHTSPGKALKVSLNSAQKAAIKLYESGVKLLYAQDFERAKAAFEKLIQSNLEDKEIVERARIHLKLCEQKLAAIPPPPRTVEDHYNLAIALMNEGKYEQSIEHLNKALKYNPNCDYVIYALAASNCRIGNFDGALNNLKTAIHLKPENRYLAQHDSDFEPLMQDSRFISIVYPDRTTSPIQ